MILEDYNFLYMDFQILLHQNDIKVVLLIVTRSVTLTIFVLTATSMTTIIRTPAQLSRDVDQATELLFSRHTLMVVWLHVTLALRFNLKLWNNLY
jgi:hypothetical protein